MQQETNQYVQYREQEQQHFKIMIKETLELLQSQDWLIDDEDINIAKGMYEMPSTFKELRINRKRKKITNGR